MNRFMSKLFCILLSLVLASCARPHVMVDRVLVENATTGSITNVEVRHEPSNRFGAVSAILPQKTLDIGISRQPLLANKAVIKWRDDNGRDWSAKVNIPYDRVAAEAGQPMSLVYIIYPSGEVTANIQPVDSFQ